MKSLYKNGMTISEIARRFGLDQRTASKYVKGDVQIPEYKTRQKIPRKLDPFKEVIREQIALFGINAKKAYNDILSMGYMGKYSLVKSFVRTFKQNKGGIADVRYETKPWIQSQVDWFENGTVEVDGDPQKLYYFTMVLGFSRAKYMECTLIRPLRPL
jgi:transposase